MSRKNPFPLDSTIYVIKHYSDEVTPMHVRGERIDDQCSIIFGFNEETGEIEEVFLTDRGVPGFAYDDRPCQIYASREEAEAAVPAAKAWFNNRRHR